MYSMINELKRTLEILEKINKTVPRYALLKKEEFEDEEENLIYFKITLDSLEENLKEGEKNSMQTPESILETLGGLHVDYINTIAHITNVHELIIKIIKRYGQRVKL